MRAECLFGETCQPGLHDPLCFRGSEPFQVDALKSRMCCNFAARSTYKQSPCSILKHHIFMVFHGISPVYAPIAMVYSYGIFIC